VSDEGLTSHSPLVEPDVQISRIRLSRKLSPQTYAGSCAVDPLGTSCKATGTLAPSA
jgi:hypothetical protein